MVQVEGISGSLLGPNSALQETLSEGGIGKKEGSGCASYGASSSNGCKEKEAEFFKNWGLWKVLEGLGKKGGYGTSHRGPALLISLVLVPLTEYKIQGEVRVRCGKFNLTGSFR